MGMVSLQWCLVDRPRFYQCYPNIHGLPGYVWLFLHSTLAFVVGCWTGRSVGYEDVRTVYYPEAERVLKQVTGANRILIFDHTVRLPAGVSTDHAIQIRYTGPRT